MANLSILPAGSKAAPIDVQDLGTAQPRDLASILAQSAEPHLIYWIKTGCPTCRLIAPWLERLAGQAVGRVHMISQDDPATLAAFRDQHALKSLDLLCEQAPYLSADGYGITNLPTWFWIDAASGEVQSSGMAFSQDALQRHFETLGGSGSLFPEADRSRLPSMQPG